MLQRLEGCFYEKCWQKKEATKRVKHLQQQMDEDACIYRKFFFSLSLSYPFFHVICNYTIPSSCITLCPSTSCFTIIRLWGSSKERESGGGLASTLLCVSNIVSILKVGLMGCLERVITTSSTSSEQKQEGTRNLFNANAHCMKFNSKSRQVQVRYLKKFGMQLVPIFYYARW